MASIVVNETVNATWVGPEGPGWTEAEQMTIKSVVGVASAMSLVGSLLIIYAYSRFGGATGIKLLSWLSLADVFSDIVSFVGLAFDSDSATGCKVMGFLVTTTDLAPILWTACMSYSLCVSIFYSYKTGRRSPNICCYILFSFGLPLTLSVIGMFEGVYGDSGFGLCWIVDERKRLYYFYIPLWLVVIFNSVIYALITREYRRVMVARHGTLGGSSHSRVHRLKYYPAVLVVTWFFGTLNRVLQAGGVSSFPVMLLHQGFARSQGVFNALVYGTDPMQEIYPLLKNKFCGDSTAPETEMSEFTGDLGTEGAVPDANKLSPAKPKENVNLGPRVVVLRDSCSSASSAIAVPVGSDAGPSPNALSASCLSPQQSPNHPSPQAGSEGFVEIPI